MNHRQPAYEQLYFKTSLLHRIHPVQVVFFSFLLMFTYSTNLSAQLQNSCDPVVECHNYFGTSHQAEMVACTYCTNCTQECMGNLSFTTDPVIYSFVALNSSVTIDISLDPANIIDFTARLANAEMDECYETIVSCFYTSVTEFTIEKNDLVVGGLYHLIITSCNTIDTYTNDFGEFEFTFGEGEVEEVEFLEGFEITPADDCRRFEPEEWPFCTGDKFRIWPIFNEGVSSDIFNGTIWEFSYQSNSISESVFFEFPFDYVDLPINEPGEYAIFFVGIREFSCSEFYDIGDQLIWDNIIITDDPLIYNETFTLCYRNLENGFDPPPPWSGGQITQPGTYINFLTEECECDPYQQIIVKQTESIIGEVFLELCPQDLPYYIYEDLVINPGDDIDGNYYQIEDGSLQEGYYQEYCDSIFQLFVTFVDDPDVCNQCELAYSVKLDNLVACIPFDNSELDVSLHDNHSELINGAVFDVDRFGNPEFATSLDGINDYIKINHTEEFLDDQYSFSFWFNKPENTFNDANPKEALIYKGLEGHNSKSFSITLEKHFDDKMLLDFRINSGPFEKHIRYGALDYDTWYHVAIINDFGNLKLIIDGQVVETNNGNVDNKFNGEDLLLGVIPSSSGFSGFFKGQIDEFRYWTRSLSDWEGHLLYRPESDFHITEEYFLNCCESVNFYGQEYDVNTEVDTIRIIGASPIGTDSLYIINIHTLDQAPTIIEELIPDDILVEINTICDEACSTVVEWEDITMDAFIDNCSNLTVTQSHSSPLIVHGDEDLIKVIYTATDDCGQEIQASFNITIECSNTSSPEIPEPNLLTPLASNICIDENNTVCSGTEVNWNLLHANDVNQNQSLYPTDFIADWEYILNTPTGSDTFTYINSPSPTISYTPVLNGSYELCLRSISNLCYDNNKILCNTIHVATTPDVDHGTLSICSDNLSELNDLYPELSEELTALIYFDPTQENYILLQSDACDCVFNEMANIVLVNDISPEEVILEICPEDLPFDYNGLIIDKGDIYTQKLIYLEGLSSSMNDMGESCDSSILLSVNLFPEQINSTLQVEICQGEEYEGYTESGVFESVYTNVYGCDSIINLELTVLPNDDPNCMPTATQEQLSSILNIYPVPSTDILIIDSGQRSTSNLLSYQIISTNGKLIRKGVLNESKNTIEISNLESGIYILRVYSNQGTQSMKFVVAH